MRSFAIDSDRPRVSSQLYSLFRAGSPGERLDQADRGGQPSNWGKIGTRKEEGRWRDRTGDGMEHAGGRGWERTVKFSRLLEESMSTTVNYDKYRDCDAAILEGLERLCAGWILDGSILRPTSFSISPSGYPPYIPKAAANLSATRHAENTVCRPCNAEQADPSSLRCQMEGRRGHRGSRRSLLATRVEEINLTIPNFPPSPTFHSVSRSSNLEIFRRSGREKFLFHFFDPSWKCLNWINLSRSKISHDLTREFFFHGSNGDRSNGDLENWAFWKIETFILGWNLSFSLFENNTRGNTLSLFNLENLKEIWNNSNLSKSKSI